MQKSKQELLNWLEEELRTATDDRKIYIEEIARFIDLASDRRGRFSWGPGDVEMHDDRE